MAQPTISNKIAAEYNRKEATARRRSEAAKKAWRTRRRRAKLSLAMRKTLESLMRDGARISLGYTGGLWCHVGIKGVNADGSQFVIYGPKPTKSTFRALEKRGMVELERRRNTGGTTTYYNDGAKEHRESFDLDYQITEKGRKALNESK